MVLGSKWSSLADIGSSYIKKIFPHPFFFNTFPFLLWKQVGARPLSILALLFRKFLKGAWEGGAEHTYEFPWAGISHLAPPTQAVVAIVVTGLCLLW